MTATWLEAKGMIATPERLGSRAAFRIVAHRLFDSARIVVLENLTIERAVRMLWRLRATGWQHSIEPMPVRAITPLQRRRELQALRDSPGGRLRVSELYRKMVLLPGDILDDDMLIDLMIDDIVDVEFERM